MTLQPHTRTVITSLAIATAIGAAAPAHADTTDLRSPDARDAGLSVQRGSGVVPGPDLRTPDARDAGLTASSTPGASRVDADGFDLGDAAVGAAGTLGVIAIATGGAFTISRRRRGAALLPAP